MNQLTLLVVAMGSFVGTHFLLSHPLRAPLVGRIGEGPFLGLYSLVAALTLGWVIFVALSFPAGEPLWVAPTWFWQWGAPILMLIASILLVGSNLGNPAFPNPTGQVQAVRPARGVFAITRHPMNWAFMIWALTHIALIGDADNLVIASGIFVLTFFGSLLQDRKKEALLGDAWRGWETRTSFLPFGAIASGRIPLSAAWPGWIALIGGAALWVGASWLHKMPVGPWEWFG